MFILVSDTMQRIIDDELPNLHDLMFNSGEYFLITCIRKEVDRDYVFAKKLHKCVGELIKIMKEDNEIAIRWHKVIVDQAVHEGLSYERAFKAATRTMCKLFGIRLKVDKTNIKFDI